MQRHEFRAMGSGMQALIDDEGPAAAAALAEVPRWFEEWEACLSRFRDDSELTRMNIRAGGPVHVSPIMAAVLEAALQARRDSDGLVDPTLLPALEATGYDRNFADLARYGVSIRPAPHSSGEGEIEWNAATHTVVLPPGARLDFGGIAKGWAAGEALARLSAHGPALVDAGGDIAAGAAPHGASGWPVGIADPLRPDDEILALLIVAGRGVATSGRDYRRWQQGGAWQHHILDPRTGRPAETDALSATVVAPTARDAEVAAKAVLILGSAEGLAWLEARPALAGLLVLADGTVAKSRRLAEYEWKG